jgi:phosphatidate cytidylyltransferase
LARALSEPAGPAAGAAAAGAAAAGAAAADGGKWRDFSMRTASAAILAPVALLALWHGGLAWTLLIAVAMAGLGAEWARLAGLWKFYPLPLFLLLVLVVSVLSGWLAGFLLLAGLTCAVFWSSGWLAAAGLPYAGIGGLSLLWLRLQPAQGFRDTLFLVIVIWGTDIGAYLVGRLLGGPKLAPAISPGKTWSGSIGGLLAGGAGGAALAGGWLALPAALALSVFAQAGDLLESAIKRKLGVKDSGRTIPGHGGLFDRLDGFLAAAPVAALLAHYVQGGLPIWR